METGFQDIFAALMGQQAQPSVEVDEMQQGVQAQRDEMAQVQALGQNDALSGMNAMFAALDAAGVKDKDLPKTPFWKQPNT